MGVPVRPWVSPYVAMLANYKPSMRIDGANNVLVATLRRYRPDGDIVNGNNHFNSLVRLGN